MKAETSLPRQSVNGPKKDKVQGATVTGRSSDHTKSLCKSL